MVWTHFERDVLLEPSPPSVNMKLKSSMNDWQRETGARQPA